MTPSPISRCCVDSLLPPTQHTTMGSAGIVILAAFSLCLGLVRGFPTQDLAGFRPAGLQRIRRSNRPWPLPISSSSCTRASGAPATVYYNRQHLPLFTTSTAIVGDLPATNEDVEQTDAVVCGGGPAGLLTAIMLAQQKSPNKKLRFPQIQLYDRLSPPPGPDDEAAWSDVAKFYLIGLGGRGQTALDKFGVWEAVKKRCIAVVGRRDWSPGGPPEGVERIFGKERSVTTQILPRDKLVGVLHQHILENFADRIQLNYGYEVQPVDFDYNDKTSALIRVSKCIDPDLARMNPSSVKTSKENPEEDDVLCDTDDFRYVSANLLVAADGTIRTIANAIEDLDQKRLSEIQNPIKKLRFGKPFQVVRYPDDNQRIYKTVPMKIPSDWRPDLNYSARTAEGRINFDALPANTKGDFCGVLLLKKGDPMAQADTDPAALRELLDEALPQFSALLDDETIAAVAQKPVSYLPGFRYVGPRLHEGNSCVILGDCAHTVKPYFGLGANSALEDVEELEEYLQANPDSLGQAIREFSQHRAPESKTLVRISRDLDRPGALGFLVFILPIILDSMFGKFFPKLFQPNIITMLQKDGYTFQQVARRKRLDRLVQFLVLAAGVTGSGIVARLATRAAAILVGVKQRTIWGTVLGFASLPTLVKRMIPKENKELQKNTE